MRVGEQFVHVAVHTRAFTLRVLRGGGAEDGAIAGEVEEAFEHGGGRGAASKSVEFGEDEVSALVCGRI